MLFFWDPIALYHQTLCPNISSRKGVTKLTSKEGELQVISNKKRDQSILAHWKKCNEARESTAMVEDIKKETML